MDETNVQCSQQTLITCLLCTLRTRTLFVCAECCCRCSLWSCMSVYTFFYSVVSGTMGIVCVCGMFMCCSSFAIQLNARRDVMQSYSYHPFISSTITYYPAHCVDSQWQMQPAAAVGIEKKSINACHVSERIENRMEIEWKTGTKLRIISFEISFSRSYVHKMKNASISIWISFLMRFKW